MTSSAHSRLNSAVNVFFGILTSLVNVILPLTKSLVKSYRYIPMGIINSSISSAGRALVELLLETENMSSQIAKDTVNSTPQEDYLAVMEEILENLRQISDWSRKPKGFAGAMILAKKDSDCKQTLKQFLNSLPQERWMAPALRGIE